MNAIATTHSIQQDLLDLDDRRCAALLQQDFSTIDALFAEELVYIHSSAMVEKKASYLSGLQTGAVVYRQIDRQDRQVQICGDTATLTGVAHMRVARGDDDRTIHIRYVTVSVQREQTWQIILFASTALPAMAPPHPGPRPPHPGSDRESQQRRER